MKNKSVSYKTPDSLARASTHLETALVEIKKAKEVVKNNHKEVEEALNGKQPFNRRVVPYPWENRAEHKKRKLPPE